LFYVRDTPNKIGAFSKMKTPTCLKPSPVLEKYLDAKFKNPLIKDGIPLIQGLPSGDVFIQQAKKEQEEILFPVEALKEEAEQKVREVIKTPLVELPKGMKKVAFTHEGVEGYLIGTPVGNKHQRVQWVTKEGDILHEAVIFEGDFPNVLVVDDFKNNFLDFEVSHGLLVERFLKRFNPFLNVEEVQYKDWYDKGTSIWQQILNRLRDERINAINYSIAHKEVLIKKEPNLQAKWEKGPLGLTAVWTKLDPIKIIREKVIADLIKLEKESIPELNTEVEKLKKIKILLEVQTLDDFMKKVVELGEIDQVEAIEWLKTNTDTLDTIKEQLKTEQTDAEEKISVLEQKIKSNKTFLDYFKTFSDLTKHGKYPSIFQKPVDFYQAIGNEGFEEKSSPGFYLVAPDIAMNHGYRVGGTQADGSLHPQVNSAILVNKTAPFSYEVTTSEEGANITGGHPKIEGIDISPEDMGMDSYLYNLYKRFGRSNLPNEIEGTSYASPTALAKDWLPKVADAVRKNEGKLPNQVPEDLQRNMKTLGINVPKQGPPSY
jgi:hypothetical protein